MVNRDGDIVYFHALFWPAVVGLGALTTVPMFYPFIEARRLKDKASHHLLQRPRDVPVRTAVGAMALSFYVVLWMSGGNDVIADKFDISLNAMTWVGRIGVVILPPISENDALFTLIGQRALDEQLVTCSAHAFGMASSPRWRTAPRPTAGSTPRCRPTTDPRAASTRSSTTVTFVRGALPVFVTRPVLPASPATPTSALSYLFTSSRSRTRPSSSTTGTNRWCAG